VLLLAIESSNNQNAILIIAIYTSVDHSIGAISMAERKLCASVDGNICWVKFTKFFQTILASRWAQKPSTMAEKNLGFGDGRFLQKT